MDILKYDIEKILSTENVKVETTGKTFDFIKVKMLINSCGVLMENEKMFHIDEWTLVKKFGYFLG